MSRRWYSFTVVYTVINNDLFRTEVNLDQEDETAMFIRDMFKDGDSSDQFWGKVRFTWVLKYVATEVKEDMAKSKILNCHGSEIEMVGQSIEESKIGAPGAVRTGQCKNCGRSYLMRMKGLMMDTYINR